MPPGATREQLPRSAADRSWRWALVLLALGALSARLLAFAVLGPERYAGAGYLYYEEMADHVLAGEGLYRTLPYGHGDRFAIRSPGYPLLIAGLKLLPGDLTGKIALCGALFGTASVLLIALIASRLLGRTAGLVAGAALALWPAAVVHDGAMQDTALYSALMLGGIALTLRLAGTSAHRSALLLAAGWGALAAAAILVRVTLLPTFLALALWLAWRASGPAPRRLLTCSLALIVMLAGLAPWLARNARVVGAPVLSSDVGRSLWLGNNPQTFSVYPGRSIDRAEELAWASLTQGERDHVRSLAHDELAQDDWFRDRAFAHAREFPGATLAGWARKLSATFSPWMSPRADPVKQAVHFASWGLALILGLAGAWSLRRRAVEFAPLWMPIALLAAHSAIFFGHSAYRAHVDALVLALAALPVAAFLERRWPSVAAPRFTRASLVFLAALAARLMLVAGVGELETPAQEWERGYELGAVARSVAAGEGFANPFLFESGPTAAVGPGLPLLLALPFRLLGPESDASWRLLVLLNVAASALVAPLLLWFGSALASPRAGLVASLAWCVDPVALLSVRAWQGHVYVLLATAGIAAVILLDRAIRARGSLLPAVALAGTLVGAGLWFEPMLIPALVAWAACVACRERGSPRLALAPLAALMLAFVIIAPWIVRNAVVVGSASIRSWAGPELYLGAAAGPFEPTPVGLTPMRNAAERARLQALGEGAYVAEKFREARALTLERPGRVLASSASRYLIFWLGRPEWWRKAPDHPVIAGAASALRGAWHLGLFALAVTGLVRARKRIEGLGVIVAILALYPVTYALTHVEARYRLPLEPLLLACAVLAFLPRDRRSVDDDEAGQHASTPSRSPHP